MGYDYIFFRLPHVSLYQMGIFILASYTWFCAGLVQVASVITQAVPDHRSVRLIKYIFVIKITIFKYCKSLDKLVKSVFLDKKNNTNWQIQASNSK